MYTRSTLPEAAIHVAHPPMQSSNLHLPATDTQEMKPEDFKDPIEIPKVRFAAGTILGFLKLSEKISFLRQY